MAGLNGSDWSLQGDALKQGILAIFSISKQPYDVSKFVMPLRTLRAQQMRVITTV